MVVIIMFMKIIIVFYMLITVLSMSNQLFVIANTYKKQV